MKAVKLKLLYCDESNLERRDNDFFVYAGISIPAETAFYLHQEFERIRIENQVPSTFQLKFNPGPTNLNHAQFAFLKQRVIEVAASARCKLFVSLILHNVAKDPDTARRNAINQIAYNFNSDLAKHRDHGLVLIDRFTDGQVDGHLREKFSRGILGLPYSPEFRLAQIVGFHYSAVGQSHFSSLIDIVLGSLRFAINAFSREEAGKIQTAELLLRSLAPLFEFTPYANERGQNWVETTSLDFTPKTIKSDQYRQKYSELRSFLAKNGIMAAQPIR